MTAYYNENDPKAAAWLRELIKRNLIAPGDVDERSILDVQPADLEGYAQCHFFAGIGVWSHALRCAGWPDDRPAWTGSCPCQPFSAAGKRCGDADLRHLWPAWFRLIEVRRPDVCFGEQVSSADGLAWIDFVRADLEGCGYALGVLSTTAAGVGAPHIRQRLYFVADAQHAERRTVGCSRENDGNGDDAGRSKAHRVAGTRSEIRLLADAERGAAERHGQSVGGTTGGDQGIGKIRSGPQRVRVDAGNGGDTRLLADAEDAYWRGTRGAAHSGRGTAEAGGRGDDGDMAHPLRDGSAARIPGQVAWDEGYARVPVNGSDEKPEPCNNFWRDALWLPCRDGKARPTQPGIFPLAHGAPARVVRLRGYGNAIVAPQATAFVTAYMGITSPL